MSGGKSLKILLIGNSMVGKTSLLKRYTDKDFDFDVISTVGVDFSNFERMLGGEEFKVQIWDTAGQEKFRTITSNYYRNSNGVAIVYDLTMRESFEQIDVWFNEISKNKTNEVATIILANKVDLTDQRVVTREEGEKLAQSRNSKYFEVSAKSGLGVDEAFEVIIEESYKAYLRNPKGNESKERVKFQGGSSSNTKKGGFC